MAKKKRAASTDALLGVFAQLTRDDLLRRRIDRLVGDRRPTRPRWLAELGDTFVRFCHAERSIPEPLTSDTLAAVDHFEPEYHRLIRSDRPMGPVALMSAQSTAHRLKITPRAHPTAHLAAPAGAERRHAGPARDRAGGHPEHDDLDAWIDGEWDAEAFDRDDLTRELALLRLSPTRRDR